MMSDQDFKVIDQMEKCGGSFVKALAVCFRRADHINFEKLRTVFPEYWNQYEAQSKKNPSPTSPDAGRN